MNCLKCNNDKGEIFTDQTNKRIYRYLQMCYSCFYSTEPGKDREFETWIISYYF